MYIHIAKECGWKRYLNVFPVEKDNPDKWVKSIADNEDDFLVFRFGLVTSVPL